MKIGLFFLCMFGMLLSWPVYVCMAEEERDHICFRRIDADRDGIVTFQEFTIYYGKDHKKFSMADKNGDDQLTHDEYHSFLGHGVTQKP